YAQSNAMTYMPSDFCDGHAFVAQVAAIKMENTLISVYLICSEHMICTIKQQQAKHFLPSG
ncbi:MAG: hypothetical protein ACRCVL_02855, partial [Cetobacterium sp.]